MNQYLDSDSPLGLAGPHNPYSSHCSSLWELTLCVFLAAATAAAVFL